MKLRPWQIHWQIGLEEELHLCLSPGTRACSSHTGHVSHLLLLSTHSWFCQPHTVSITQPNTWQDKSDLRYFSSRYVEGARGQKWRAVSQMWLQSLLHVSLYCSSVMKISPKLDSCFSELSLRWWASILPWHLDLLSYLDSHESFLSTTYVRKRWCKKTWMKNLLKQWKRISAETKYLDYYPQVTL